jgi:hypothetical protein
MPAQVISLPLHPGWAIHATDFPPYPEGGAALGPFLRDGCAVPLEFAPAAAALTGLTLEPVAAFMTAAVAPPEEAVS